MTKRRNRPTKGGAALTSTATDYSKSSGDYRHQPLTPDERAVQKARALLEAHGYGIAARCLTCSHPITSALSLRRMRGPRCHAKAVNE